MLFSIRNKINVDNKLVLKKVITEIFNNYSLCSNSYKSEIY